MSAQHRRCINVDGEACSPQSFEGYLLHQAEKYGDWKSLGTVTYEFI